MEWWKVTDPRIEFDRSRFYVGVDLGQSADFTAVCLLERKGDDRRTCHLAVRDLHRYPLQTGYDVIVADLAKRLQNAPRGTKIIFDRTGVGAGVFDFFKRHELMRHARVNILGVNIHGGDAVTMAGDGVYRVPKRDLVGAVAVPLQTKRLKILADLGETPQLVREMENFKVKIDPVTSHDSYSSWRESDHDDLILALALACWTAQHANFEQWRTSNHPRLQGSA